MDIDIRMILLISGVIVIGKYVGDPMRSLMALESPAEVVIKRTAHGPLGFALYPWLPNELLDDYSVGIPKEQIISELYPSSALLKFYETWTKEEVDKLKEFKELFDQQITKLGESYAKRSKLSRERQQKTQSPIDTTLSDALIQLFEDDNGWGDPSVTH